jgi:hypothetical protein
MRINSFVVAFVGALVLPGIVLVISRLTLGRRHE